MTVDFIICNRKKPRWATAQLEDASIECELVEARCRFTLLDVSADGVSFFVPRAAPRVAQGSPIVNALVHVGAREVEGDVHVVHVTQADSGSVCGATFHPASDSDAGEWEGLIEELRSANALGLTPQPESAESQPTGSRRHPG